jgi:predicted dehydrogenase
MLDTQRRTGRDCRVTFNYRYAPWNTTIKQALMSGSVGRLVSTTRRHAFGQTRGAEFFPRWHACMANSGGMLVHKSTHYFDLMNFFVAATPKTVFARGARNIFNAETAARMGLTPHGKRCGDCPCAERCPFYRDYRTQGEDLGAVEARGRESGYYRDEGDKF